MVLFGGGVIHRTPEFTCSRPSCNVLHTPGDVQCTREISFSQDFDGIENDGGEITNTAHYRHGVYQGTGGTELLTCALGPISHGAFAPAIAPEQSPLFAAQVMPSTPVNSSNSSLSDRGICQL